MDSEGREFTRVFDARMAKEIGLNESIVLSQLCYWISLNKKAGRNFIDGRYWTYNTFEQWHEQFPFWSVRTIKNVFSNLKKRGLITVGNHNKLNIDRTNWYSVNEDVLSRLCNSCTMESVILAQPIPETNNKEYLKEKRGRVLSAERSEPPHVSYPHVETMEPEKKITRQKCVDLFGEQATQDAKQLVDEYIDIYYPKYRGKEHPRVTHAARYAYVCRILRCAMELCYTNLEFAREALLCAVKSEKAYDPQIYLVTRPQVIGLWIYESDVSGPEIFNNQYYGKNPLWLKELPDISEIPVRDIEFFKENYRP